MMISHLTIDRDKLANGAWSMVKVLATILAFDMLVLWGMAIFGNGCASPGLGPVGVEQSYTAEIVACASIAGLPDKYNRVEDLACRARVNCRYGLGGCDDGGAK